MTKAEIERMNTIQNKVARLALGANKLMVINPKVGHPRRFIDSLRFFVRAGRGGNGYPKYGGIGGKGGDVYVEALKDISLSKTKSKTQKLKIPKAIEGGTSKYFKVFGEPGEDVVIPVPTGTLVKTDVGQELGEMMTEGDRVLVARGGVGGNRDNGFIGQKGEGHHIRLLLKLIADVGLVGFPNAGKSTFLRAVSHAKPKIASYPFTTLHPTVGVTKFDDGRQISIADLPGLIEGAWKNTGMGHMFLRHIERTKLLLFVVDIEGFRLGPEYPQRSPIENVILLNRELELYQPELVEKPALLIINKMDTNGSDEKFKKFQSQLENIKELSQTMPEEVQPDRFVQFSDVLPCSAKYESLENVKERIRSVIDVTQCNYDDKFLENIHASIKDKLYVKSLKLL